MIEWIDVARDRVGIFMDQQFHAAFLRHAVAQLVHGLELPGRIDMEQGKRRRRRVESLACKMQHHGGILAHRIQHHGILCLRDHLTQDMDRFGLKTLQMRQAGRRRLRLRVGRQWRG